MSRHREGGASQGTRHGNGHAASASDGASRICIITSPRQQHRQTLPTPKQPQNNAKTRQQRPTPTHAPGLRYHYHHPHTHATRNGVYASWMTSGSSSSATIRSVKFVAKCLSTMSTSAWRRQHGVSNRKLQPAKPTKRSLHAQSTHTPWTANSTLHAASERVALTPHDS